MTSVAQEPGRRDRDFSNNALDTNFHTENNIGFLYGVYFILSHTWRIQLSAYHSIFLLISYKNDDVNLLLTDLHHDSYSQQKPVNYAGDIMEHDCVRKHRHSLFPLSHNAMVQVSNTNGKKSEAEPMTWRAQGRGYDTNSGLIFNISIIIKTQ